MNSTRLLSTLSCLGLLAAIAGPPIAQAQEFPAPLPFRIASSDAIVVGRVRHVAPRSSYDIIEDIREAHEGAPRGKTIRHVYRVPRMRAEVEVVQALRGRHRIRKDRIVAFYGQGARTGHWRVMQRGARVLLFLVERSEGGFFEVLDDVQGALAFAGSDTLSDGSGLHAIRAAVAEVEAEETARAVAEATARRVKQAARPEAPRQELRGYDRISPPRRDR